MPVVVASAHLSDDEFVGSFTTCALPLAGFRHGDHLRLAWIQLHAHGPDDALLLVQSGIQRFAQHYGLTKLYHETMTTAWVRLLATHSEPDFASFLANHGDRLTRELLHRFWTPSLLSSQEARVRWLPPDRAPLPQARH